MQVNVRLTPSGHSGTACGLYLRLSYTAASTPIEDSLKHWVVDHIINSDKKMSLMVQKKKSFLAKLRNRLSGS